MRKYIIFILIFFITVVSSCKVNSYNESGVSIENDNKQNSKSETLQYSFTTKRLTEESEINRISFKYPETSQGSNSDNINKLIKFHVHEYLQKLCESYSYNVIDNDNLDDWEWNENLYSTLAIDVDYRIAYNENNIISIIFEGLFNVKGPANPHHLFFTLNINTKDAARIYINDLYNIKEDFIDEFIEYAKEHAPDNFKKESWVYLWQTENKNTVTESFKKADSLGGVMLYFTNEFIGISLPVSASAGNHVEIEIKKEYLDKYEK